jgi:hypothetical protein
MVNGEYELLVLFSSHINSISTVDNKDGIECKMAYSLVHL